MKTSTFVAACLAPVTVFGAAVIRKRETTRPYLAPMFLATNVYADCEPHGSYCSYSFDITNGTTVTTCSARPLAEGVGLLPEVGPTACSDPEYSFEFKYLPSNGIALSVTQTYNATNNVSSVHTITGSEIYTENDGSMNTQHYNGTSAFAFNAVFTVA